MRMGVVLAVVLLVGFVLPIVGAEPVFSKSFTVVVDKTVKTDVEAYNKTGIFSSGLTSYITIDDGNSKYDCLNGACKLWINQTENGSNTIISSDSAILCDPDFPDICVETDKIEIKGPGISEFRTLTDEMDNTGELEITSTDMVGNSKTWNIELIPKLFPLEIKIEPGPYNKPSGIQIFYIPDVRRLIVSGSGDRGCITSRKDISRYVYLDHPPYSRNVEHCEDNHKDEPCDSGNLYLGDLYSKYWEKELWDAERVGIFAPGCGGIVNKGSYLEFGITGTGTIKEFGVKAYPAEYTLLFLPGSFLPTNEYDGEWKDMPNIIIEKSGDKLIGKWVECDENHKCDSGYACVNGRCELEEEYYP